MQYGLTLDLRDDDAVAEYVEAHGAVWPPVVARLRAAGVRDMQIYLLGRRLFMWLDVPDGFDPGREFARILEDPVSLDWDTRMRRLQVPVPEARDGELWAEMRPVFRLSAEP